MSEETPEPDPYPWLPAARVNGWIKIKASDAAKVANAELARKGVADWIQGKRPDLWMNTEGQFPATFTPNFEPGPDVTFQAEDKVILAALIAAQRVYSLIDTAGFDTLGIRKLLDGDDTVASLLGLNRNFPVG